MVNLNPIQEKRQRNGAPCGANLWKASGMRRMCQPYQGTKLWQRRLQEECVAKQRHWGRNKPCLYKKQKRQWGWSTAVNEGVLAGHGKDELPPARELDRLWARGQYDLTALRWWVYTCVLMRPANLVIWTQNNAQSSWLIRVSMIFGVNKQKSWHILSMG